MPEASNPELEEEFTDQEIIAAVCQGYVDDEICDEIASEESLENALALAYGALLLAGIDDPESFLIEEGILVSRIKS